MPKLEKDVIVAVVAQMTLESKKIQSSCVSKELTSMCSWGDERSTIIKLPHTGNSWGNSILLLILWRETRKVGDIQNSKPKSLRKYFSEKLGIAVALSKQEKIRHPNKEKCKKAEIIPARWFPIIAPAISWIKLIPSILHALFANLFRVSSKQPTNQFQFEYFMIEIIVFVK